MLGYLLSLLRLNELKCLYQDNHLKGFKSLLNSFVECVTFLLDQRMEWFSLKGFAKILQRNTLATNGNSARKDNPDFNHCLNNDNTIRIQREVSVGSDNTRGEYDRKRAWENVTDEALPKLKRNAKII